LQPSTDARDRAEGNAHLSIYLFQLSEVWTFEVSPGHSGRGKCWSERS
jgi:hypothetical protein